MNKYDLTNAEDIVAQIEQSSEIQLNKIIGAVIRRYNTLHADREATFLSLPIDPHTRDEELKRIICFIQSYYIQRDSR